MNLVDGRILDAEACDTVLDELEDRITATLEKGYLDPERVIAACGRFVSHIDEDAYLQVMEELGIEEMLGRRYLQQARLMFSEDSLRDRLHTELGTDYRSNGRFAPSGGNYEVAQEIRPIGVLLHIAAGNADGLPVFSVLEGLLTGNVNILKLPAAEGGLSVRLLLELIREEPLLAEYIYVFDYSSRDVLHVRQLIASADAVVVWGGAEAVSALRTLVPANVRLIEWGHKVSFAYVTEQGLLDMGEEALKGLASNIVMTKQLLCSSIQGVFVDTSDMKSVYAFCRRFLPILENMTDAAVKEDDVGLRSQIALRLYNEQLETMYNGGQIFRARGCSLIAYPDSKLETSLQFSNAWVRPLPSQNIISVLRPYKNFLQTVGLVCADDQRKELSEKLFKTGVVRVCSGRCMSEAYNGLPHDGEFPLRRYTKIVSMQSM